MGETNNVRVFAMMAEKIELTVGVISKFVSKEVERPEIYRILGLISIYENEYLISYSWGEEHQ